MVGQRVGLGQVALQGIPQGGKRRLVNPKQQLAGGWGGDNLVEKNLQVVVRHGFEAQRGLPHFADSQAQGGDMLSAIIGVQAESHFQLINRLGGDAVVENLMESLE